MYQEPEWETRNFWIHPSIEHPFSGHITKTDQYGYVSSLSVDTDDEETAWFLLMNSFPTFNDALVALESSYNNKGMSFESQPKRRSAHSLFYEAKFDTFANTTQFVKSFDYDQAVQMFENYKKKYKLPE